MSSRSVFLLALFRLVTCFVGYQPEQVHLSLGDHLGEMVVTWSTQNYTKSAVEYGFINELNLNLNFTAIGTTREFTSKDYRSKKTRSQFIHYVKMVDLKPDSYYVYHVGSDSGWSELFGFRIAPNHSDWSPSVMIYGDMGNENPQSLPYLQSDVLTKKYDAILHIGDFAYDLDSEIGERGDEFFRQIESIAAYVPYMTCAGNHEERNNFSEYRNRFHMPGGERGSFFYSFNLGPVHFVSINTEIYYFTAWGGLKLLEEQYEWLEEDLQRANLPENRKLQPWIIIFGHRPMYCSNKKKRDCSNVNTKTRVGLEGGKLITHDSGASGRDWLRRSWGLAGSVLPLHICPPCRPPLHGLPGTRCRPFHIHSRSLQSCLTRRFFGLEELLYMNQVDLAFWGHQHSYERMFPMFNYTILNGSKDAPYTNPRATVHVTSGSAGCKEKIAPFSKKKPEWSAFRSTDYGYTRLSVVNHTHLYWEQVSADKKGDIIDKVWIIKEKIHFPPQLCSACLV